jgi:hypothetical protein
MASRSPLAILPIRTSSEVVGIGRAIDSSIRQPGVAQVQAQWKKLCGFSGRRALAVSFAAQAQLGKLKGRYRAFAEHFEGIWAGSPRTGSVRHGTTPISPAKKIA